MNKCRITVIFAVFIACGWVAPSGAEQDESTAAPEENNPELKNPIALTEASARAGKRVYDQFCVTCHAHDGKGVADVAERLAAPPSDFSDGKWKYGATDAALFTIIRQGTELGMESFKDRFDEQRTWLVVNFLRTLSKDSKITLAAESVAENPIPYGIESIKRGRVLYDNFCALCHGTDGTGYTDYLDFLSTPPADFTTGEFRYGSRDGDLFKIIRDGTPNDMEAFGDRVKADDMWHMVNYIKRFSK